MKLPISEDPDEMWGLRLEMPSFLDEKVTSAIPSCPNMAVSLFFDNLFDDFREDGENSEGEKREFNGSRISPLLFGVLPPMGENGKLLIRGR